MSDEPRLTTYVDAETFLRRTQAALESNEAANGLILGICGRLVQYPERFPVAPCLKTVEDGNGLVLAALMTPPHNLVVYGHQGDLDGGARLLAQDLAREEWPVPGVLGPSEVAGHVARAWAAVTGRRYDLGGRQRVLEVREVVDPVPGRGRLRLAADADVELVARWWHEFHVEIFGVADPAESERVASWRIAGGDVYLWEDDVPVSMAVRTRPTRHGISVGPVYTPAARRCQGYATACVGELSRLLLASGWEFCALFVNRSNAPANRVYERIGYRPVCEYDEYAFSEAMSP